MPVVIKNCFNDFHDHDRTVEPSNNDFSKNDWVNKRGSVKWRVEGG